MLPGNSSDTSIPVWIFYFSLFALITLLILLLFSCYGRVKLKKGKFAMIKGRKLRKRGLCLEIVHHFTLTSFIS